MSRLLLDPMHSVIYQAPEKGPLYPALELESDVSRISAL